MDEDAPVARRKVTDEPRVLGKGGGAERAERTGIEESGELAVTPLRGRTSLAASTAPCAVCA